jgi:hypothetical protein
MNNVIFPIGGYNNIPEMNTDVNIEILIPLSDRGL